MNHPFRFLSSSLILTGGKYYEKIFSLYFELSSKFLLFQVAFIIFYAILYVSLLSSGWVAIAVWGSVTVQGISWILDVM